MYNQRKLNFVLLLTGGLVLAGASCKKDSSNDGTVTVDDAADVITQAVAPESAGLVAQTSTATVIVTTGNYNCGIEKDTMVSGQNATGAAVTYNYSFSSSRLLSCNNGIPQSFAWNFTGKTSYDAPHISSADNTDAQFTITGLQPSATRYVFNQSYVRNGSETSKVRNKNSFTSNITIKTTDLAVDKNSGLIVSGTASVSLSGSTTNGKSFNYSGTLTFLGNKQATLDLGNGNKYSITWS
jgi:hypothetical protein